MNEQPIKPKNDMSFSLFTTDVHSGRTLYINHTQYNLSALLRKRIKCLISWASVVNHTSHPGNGFHMKSLPSYCPHSPFPLKRFTLIGAVMFHVLSIWTTSYFTWSAVCIVCFYINNAKSFLCRDLTQGCRIIMNQVNNHQFPNYMEIR